MILLDILNHINLNDFVQYVHCRLTDRVHIVLVSRATDNGKWLQCLHVLQFYFHTLYTSYLS